MTLDSGFWRLPWLWASLLSLILRWGRGRAGWSREGETRDVASLSFTLTPQKKVRNKDARVLTMGATMIEASLTDGIYCYTCGRQDAMLAIQWPLVLECTQQRNVLNPLPQELEPAGK